MLYYDPRCFCFVIVLTNKTEKLNTHYTDLPYYVYIFHMIIIIVFHIIYHLEMSDSEASGATIARNPPEVDDTKLPAGKLLKTRDLPRPKDSIPWHKVGLPVDALLLTVKECEFLSCISFLNPGFYKSHHKDLGFVYFGKIGEGNTTMKIALARCEMGPNGSTLAVKNTVTILKPKAVFCVGFCGGLSNEVKLGDVVISSKLRTYSSIKVAANGIIEDRGISVPLNQHLGKLILNADAGWKPPLKDEVEDEVDVITNGVLLSGPEVVDNEDRRADLIRRFPDATAIEMEGEGKIKVVEQRVKSKSKARSSRQSRKNRHRFFNR